MQIAAKETDITTEVLENVYDSERGTVEIEGEFDLTALERIVAFVNNPSLKDRGIVSRLFSSLIFNVSF